MEVVVTDITTPDLTATTFDDDSFFISAKIKNSYLKDSYTAYIISVSVLCRPNSQWEIEKRFKEFCSFDESLKKIGWNVGCLPEKKWVGNMDREFVSKRQNQLQKYISDVLSLALLNTSVIVRTFFYPAEYFSDCSELNDTSHQQIALTLRSEPRFSFVRFLPAIGWRRRKGFALATQVPAVASNDHIIVCWTEYCLKNACFENEISKCLRWLQRQTLPLLLPLVFFSQTNRAVLTIQPLSSPALRDILNSVEHPLDDLFLKKYSPDNKLRHNITRGFNRESFWNLARSVVGRLLILLANWHAQGLFVMNIHSGNVIVNLKPDKSGAFHSNLSEAYNAILGNLPHYYTRLLQLGPNVVRTVFDADVAAVGFILQETLNACSEWGVVETLPNDLRLLYERLCPNSPNSSLPTAGDILQQMRNEPAMAPILDVNVGLKFDAPPVDVANVYAKARSNYERRLSHHHAIFYQVNAVKHVRRSLVKDDDASSVFKDVQPNADPMLFAH